MAVGQKAVIADALKAGRKSVLEEPADELLGGDGHHLLLLPVAVVFPLEGDLTIFKRQQAPVRNGHAVGVASQILEHVLRSAKGGLGINHPFAFAEWSQVTGEGWRVAERFEVAEELELTSGIGFVQSLQHEPPESTAEDLDRQQKSRAAVNPPVMVGRQTAAGNDAMQVRMKVKVLAPAMEQSEEADFHA